MNFVTFELEEPVTKQYLENCAKNAMQPLTFTKLVTL